VSMLTCLVAVPPLGDHRGHPAAGAGV
jgi:hypothetical protein